MAMFDRGMLPCFEYYGYHITDKNAAEDFFRNMVRVYRRCGVPDDQILLFLTVQSAGVVFNGDVGKFLSEAPDEVDCREFAESTYAESFSRPCGNFCKACSACAESASGRDVIDNSILSKLVSMPYEEGYPLVRGKKLVFPSYVSLSTADACGNRLENPCVIPLTQIIYDELMADEGCLYRRLGPWDKKRSDEELQPLIEQIVSRIQRELGDIEIPCLSDPVAQKALCGFVKRKIFGVTPAADMVLESFLLSSNNADSEEEFEEELDEEMTETPEFPYNLEEDREESGKTGKVEHEEIKSISQDTWESLQVEEEPVMDEGVEEMATPNLSKAVPETEKRPDGSGKQEEEPENPLSLENTENSGKPICLEEYPYFHAKVDVTSGGWLSREDKIDYVPVSERRFIIPFAVNDEESVSTERNVIVHHELKGDALSKMIDLTSDERADRELDALQEKVRKDSCMAAEVVYVTDQERYILLVWNAATRRFNFVPLINKEEGKLQPIPYEILQALRSEKRKVICYQPYLLCGMSGLYDGKVETKNVHSIYSHCKVLMKGTSSMLEDIFDSYLYAAVPKVAAEMEKYRDLYGEYSYLLTVMPFYRYIKDLQFSYATAACMEGLCASQQKKDIMYGYSYLAAGIYPGRQGASFKLLSNNQVVYEKRMAPDISYVPGYIMEFIFANIESEEGETAVEDNVKNNQKARRLLLKELAKQQAAFYHGDLKILYMDDYKLVFYVTHTYRAVHKTDITRILMHETYRHRIPSNQLWAKFWGTSLNMIRYVNKH